MTTSVVPAAGQGILFAQQGPGTTPGYSALDDRRSNSGSLQEGVFGTSTLVTAGGVSNVAAADFMVTQRAAGVNLSVDINMPGGGFGYVQGDTINGQGLYTVPVHSANINEVIAPADATNPRVDQVILEVLDNVLDASGNNVARTRVLTGTPTVGATLATRSGAAALPGSALLLADVLVGATVTTLANAVMRDRRKWARGAYVRIVRFANAAAGNDYSTASTSFADIDGTNLKPRIECSGAPLRYRLNGESTHSVTLGSYAVAPAVDGVLTDSVGAGGDPFLLVGHTTAALTSPGQAAPWDLLPAAGSHLIGPQWRAITAGTISYLARAAIPFELVIEEMVKQNTANNTVTSG